MLSSQKNIKIVILYTDAGGAHLSLAIAIRENFKLFSPDIDVQLCNPFSKNKFLHILFEGSYSWLIDNARWLYRILFKASQHSIFFKFVSYISSVCLFDLINKTILQNSPTIYISCHPIFNLFLPKILKDKKYPDLYCHCVVDLETGHLSHYFGEPDFLFLSGSTLSKERFLRETKTKVYCFGQPLPPSFYTKNHNKNKEILDNFGLLDNKFTVLIMGGGEGVSKLEKIVKKISRSDINCQLIVVCGRNKTLEKNLKSLSYHIPVVVLGYANNIAELMSLSHVIVTKAGPYTLTEAVAAKLPIIIYDVISPQEDGNLDYILKNEAGVLCRSPQEIIDQLKIWEQYSEFYLQVKKSLQKLDRPFAGIKITQTILKSLCE